MKSKPRRFYSSNKITPDFFELDQLSARDNQIKVSMPFLWNLMYHQLSLRTNNRVVLMAGASESKGWDTLEDDDSEKEAVDDSVLDTETVGEMEAHNDEDMVYVRVDKRKAGIDRANLASPFAYPDLYSSCSRLSNYFFFLGCNHNMWNGLILV